MSEQAKELLRALLHRDPQQRLAGDALKASAWWQIEGPTDKPLSNRQSVAERTFATRGAIVGHLERFHRPTPGRIRKGTNVRELRVYSALRSSGLASFLAPLGPETSRSPGLNESSSNGVTLDMRDLTSDKEVATTWTNSNPSPNPSPNSNPNPDPRTGLRQGSRLLQRLILNRSLAVALTLTLTLTRWHAAWT